MAFEEQEFQAQKQLYNMWKAVEEKKNEVAELDCAIASEMTKIALDNSLGIQVNLFT